MPPKTSNSGAGRGRAKGSKTKSAAGNEMGLSNPFESSSDEQPQQDSTAQGRSAASRSKNVEEDGEEPEKSIPRDLLTRLLHEFFANDWTRISRDANAAVGKYMEIFLKEAIARAAMERKGGFLEVDDLEKIAPQLLLDL